MIGYQIDISVLKVRKQILQKQGKGEKSVKLLIGKVVGATKYQVRYKQGKKWKTKYTKNRALTIKKLKSKKKVKIQVRAVMVYFVFHFLPCLYLT